MNRDIQPAGDSVHSVSKLPIGSDFLKTAYCDAEFAINYLKCWERKGPCGIAEQKCVT